MEAPKTFKGMKKVKEYPNKQIRDRKINASMHL